MDNYDPFEKRYEQSIRPYEGEGVSTLLILRDTGAMTEEAIVLTADDLYRWDKINKRVPAGYDYDDWFRRNPQSTAKDWLDEAEKLWPEVP